MFMENFCNQKQVKPEVKSEKKLERRKLKSAHVGQRAGKSSRFVRMPMFDEIQKLSATQKTSVQADMKSVGWDKFSNVRNPMTGEYIGTS